VKTGAHVGPVGAGGSLDGHGVGAGAHAGSASVGAGVGER
jgi:hypothetical protein